MSRPKKIDIRSKGTRTDTELIDRYVELHRRWMFSISDREEYKAIKKEFGVVMDVAVSVQDLYDRVGKLEERLWDLDEALEQAKDNEVPIWFYVLTTICVIAAIVISLNLAYQVIQLLP